MGTENTTSAEYITDAAPAAKTGKPHTFFRRLGTAWTASALVVSILYGVVLYNETHAGTFSPQPRDQGLLWFSLALATVGIFAIAWPVETWMVKPTTSTIKAVGFYAMFIVGLTLIAMAWGYFRFNGTETRAAYGYLELYVFGMMGAVALLVACVGRAIYPLLLTRRILTGSLALGVIALLVYTALPIR